MNEVSKIFKFYRNTLILILLINTSFFFILGAYFEEYEGLLSSLVHGTYTNYAVKEWNVDTHFLLFWIYASLNQYLPNVQVYGLVLFALNWLCLLFFGLVLFRVLNVNIKNKSKVLFVFLYCIVAIDYIVNLGSTRIAFIAAISIFALIQSYLQENKPLQLFHWILFIFIFIFISLMRTEIVLLATLCYSAILIIHFKWSRHIILFLFIAIAVLILYNIVASYLLTEARQVYYFKEFDFIDRDNINYRNLMQLQLMEVSAFKQYLISDKNHFTLSFYDSIANNTSRFNIDSMLSTFAYSIKAFRVSWIYVLLAFISGVLLIYTKIQERKIRFLYFIFCLFFPLVLCIYLTVPQRFLVFYYSVISVLNLTLISGIDRIKIPVRIIIGLFLLQNIHNEIWTSNQYKKVDKKVQSASAKLKLLSNQISLSKPIVINITEYMGRYFPVNPLGKLQRQNAIFLNFWYFGSYNCYIDKWNDVCNCNPLSLKEKIDYVVSSESVFITDDKTFFFLKDYIGLKYKIKLVKKDIDVFDGDLKLCRLSYAD